MSHPHPSSHGTPSSDAVAPEIDAALLVSGVMTHALHGMAVVDPGGRLLRANPALVEISGLELQDLLSGRTAALLDAEAVDAERKAREDLLEGDEAAFTLELWGRRTDGARAWTRIRGSRLPSAPGEAPLLLYQFQDLSDEHEALAKVQQSHEMMLNAHKLEAVGRLAGGVAHEFNNLLTGIRGYARLLLEEKPLGHPDRDPLVKINRSVERATGLVSQLLAFGKQEFSKPEVLDLAKVVEGSEDLLRSLMGETVALDVDHMDHVRVRVDPRQFEQVLINLAMNSRDAMPDGGMARIALDRVRLKGEEGESAVWGVVTFADTGAGMTEEVVERIFEPFFSTRADGKGTGLGLSAVHGIIEAHDGRIEVESAPDKGTTFRIYLPSVSEVSAPKPHGEESTGPARILVVDDDPAVREVAARILRRVGYDVDEAGGASEALAKLLQGGEPPDLLLTDVIMPGMNGRELSEQVLKAFPGTKVLFMSAYTEDEVILRGVRVAEVNFLPKPFSLESLAEGVQKVLQSAAPEPEPV